MKYFILIFSIIFWCPAYSAPSAGVFKLDLSKSKGEIGFRAVGNPSALKINGKSDSSPENIQGVVEVGPSKISGTISLSLKSLNTGIKLRDRHMKNKYLEVKKFPTAQLEISQLNLPDEFFNNLKTELKKMPFSGKLKVHGIEKGVEGFVNLKRDENRIIFQTQFPIQLSDYDIDVPSFMGVTVAQKVTVYANIETDLDTVK